MNRNTGTIGALRGTIVAAGTPEQVARSRGSRTAPYLARSLGKGARA